MQHEPLFGRVVLVSGPESLLAERAVERLVGQASQERPEASVNKVDAATLDAGGLAEVTGGSLFAESSIVVLQGADELPQDLFDAVAALASTPNDDLTLVVVHPGGNRGKGLLDRLKKARVEVVDCPAVKPFELPQFAISEARQRGGRLDQPTAVTLVEALGSDVRAVVGAVRQLLDDSEDHVISDRQVRRYFAGRAGVSGFRIADDVLAGRRNEALGLLRWALENGEPAPKLTAAVASSLRSLGRYLDARDARLRDADLARQIGVPPFKIKDLARQSRDWTPRGVADAIRCVARVDADTKGAATDAGYALERMVIEIADLRGRRPDATMGD